MRDEDKRDDKERGVKNEYRKRVKERKYKSASLYVLGRFCLWNVMMIVEIIFCIFWDILDYHYASMVSIF